jgi:thiol peroxidase
MVVGESPRTVDQLDERVDDASEPVLVSFNATWHPTYEAMTQQTQRLAEQFAGEIEFVSIDVDQAPELVDRFAIVEYPTLILFVDGQESGRWLGDTPEVVIADALNQATTPEEAPAALAERTGVVTFGGVPQTLIGPELAFGDQAPEVVLLASDLTPVPLLAAAEGKVMVISVVPSLDTGVCAAQTLRFNAEAAELGDGVAVFTISMDLPFAQGRWTYSKTVTNLQTLSDHRDAAFGEAYGVLIKENRLLARSVFVIDRDGIIRYVEIVPEMINEPNYETALTVAAQLAE